MTDEEKKPYLDKVIELKAEYEKAMEIYNATEKEVLLYVLDQEEGSDKYDKDAPAVPTRQEIVTLRV
ncbi:high mobility group B protein 7-like, partial [Trifolium medium]|nr:high mobility group B protein 7-like [Trifolium medium]